MKFKCSYCKIVMSRDGRAKVYNGHKYIMSICEFKGGIARAYRVSDDEKTNKKQMLNAIDRHNRGV